MAADNMISDDTDADPAPGVEIPVSADGLSVDGTPPGEGDTVDFNVSGKVSRVDGDTVYVMIDQANGSPLPTPAAPTDPSESDMRGLASSADSSGSMY